MDRDLNPQEVRELQHLLNRAGYSIHADGVFGKELRDALSAWQRRVGMRDDGSPTYEVFERLRRDFDGHFAPPEAEAPPEWVKVERGQNREPGYVQLSKTKPVKFEVKSLAINYNAGQPSGIETVSSESIQMVKKILSHPDTVAIGALEITGKTYYGRGGEKNGLRLLSRQAALMDAISQLGYDVSRIKVSASPAEKPEEEDMVYLKVGFSGPETTWVALSKPNQDEKPRSGAW